MGSAMSGSVLDLGTRGKPHEVKFSAFHWRKMVYPEGIEPTTLGLEGRCSIQLSYGQKSLLRKTGLTVVWWSVLKIMVGAKGFEPSTLWSQTRCATRLRYTPTSL